MRNAFHRYSKYAFGFFVTIFVLSLICWIDDGGFNSPGQVEAKIIKETKETKETIVLDKDNPQIKKVMAIQNRHNRNLMAKPEVVGVATGLTETSSPAIVVYTKKEVKPGRIPNSLEGVPVVVKVTGEFYAMKPPSNKGNKGSTSTRYPRPTPIGVSTGNEGECSAGTIGARVTDALGEVYALSNNHVYALENNASIESKVLQPGLYDSRCRFDEKRVIGTLDNYVEISFLEDDPYSTNTIDAAIASSTTALLGNATPSNGYGVPKSETCADTSSCMLGVGLYVQKYGRTTSLTCGKITGLNATVNVSYYGSGKTARFINQIFVESAPQIGCPVPFIQPGDSGSLLVTAANRYPVGLLFAGSLYGIVGIANPIDDVLGAFGVSIDGEN